VKRLTSVGVVATAIAAGLAIAPAGASEPTSALPSTTAAARAAALQAAQSDAATTASALGLGSDERLTVRDVITDFDGSTYTRYDRTFKGLRVLGGDLIVHRAADGALRGSTKNAAKVAVASVTPKVTASSAAGKAATTTSLRREAKPKGELVVFATKGGARLAHEMVVKGIRPDQTPSEMHVVVDAANSKVLARWDRIRTGTGDSMYAGDVEIGTSAGFELKDPSRGANYTTDLNGGQSGEGTLFTDADDAWGNGTPQDRQTAGVDAHYGAQLTWDYYKNVHNRNGIWDDGQGSRSRVHYGNGYVNAFWDGTQMTYGDGAGNVKPLTSIDVAGHEMSHGVTEATANLNYFGDAGGLNESTSDIFGTSVEFAANNAEDAGDYLIGEKIDIRGDGTPLRYMDKPSRDGASVDCWSTSTGGMDPHYSSGPLNHWFYLASEGSGAKEINGVQYDSPTCDGSTVTGIGRDKVEKVWYRTLSTKLNSGSDYADAREGAIASAKELYGAGSAECQGIAAAFTAIDVAAGAEQC
jgi:Zn-dependent metalloprotease